MVVVLQLEIQMVHHILLDTEELLKHILDLEVFIQYPQILVVQDVTHHLLIIMDHHLYSQHILEMENT